MKRKNYNDIDWKTLIVTLCFVMISFFSLVKVGFTNAILLLGTFIFTAMILDIIRSNNGHI